MPARLVSSVSDLRTHRRRSRQKPRFLPAETEGGAQPYCPKNGGGAQPAGRFSNRLGPQILQSHFRNLLLEPAGHRSLLLQMFFTHPGDRRLLERQGCGAQ
jgi:hypothetical protein